MIIFRHYFLTFCYLLTSFRIFLLFVIFYFQILLFSKIFDFKYTFKFHHFVSCVSLISYYLLLLLIDLSFLLKYMTLWPINLFNFTDSFSCKFYYLSIKFLFNPTYISTLSLVPKIFCNLLLTHKFYGAYRYTPSVLNSQKYLDFDEISLHLLAFWNKSRSLILTSQINSLYLSFISFLNYFL